jgi:hypothetical protein
LGASWSIGEGKANIMLSSDGPRAKACSVNAASILAARKLMQYEGRRSPAIETAISEAITLAGDDSSEDRREMAACGTLYERLLRTIYTTLKH